VVILGIPEGVFWGMDISFVMWVAENKSAHENWLAAVREEEAERIRRK